jgi:hypothetical protein
MAREVLRLRGHPAGRFADRLYAEERARPPVTQTELALHQPSR